MSAHRLFLFVPLALSIAIGQEGGQSQNDPHRPLCTSAPCRSVKSFVKAHYCGGRQGNGPDDGCEIRQPKERPNIRVEANYNCKWTDGVRSCKQQGAPPAGIRNIVVGRLRSLGLPAKPKGQIYFTVWQPTGLSWSLVEAYYDRLSGSEVTLEGDAYEDHWIEVIAMKEGVLRTIFSGLGYYL